MQSDREKLIELIAAVRYCPQNDEDFGGCAKCKWLPDEDCTAARIAEHLLANGVMLSKDTDVHSKWISVEDEKPKRGGEYFVSYVFENCDMRFYGAAFWHDDMETNGYVTGPHFSNEGVDGMKVTHWMGIPKLPQPPREE